MSSPPYRRDIDALRAVAVLGVVAFHAFPGIVRSGFTGVDVFFVISGYLITGIIARDVAAGRFSFTDFYARRIRRIFPALLITLLATLAIGWRTLFSSELAQLGKHVAAGAGFVSNLVLYSEAGYFDSRSDTKPLLHLWSLGVEEQFYLLWPIFLLAAMRWSRRIDLTLLGVAAVSFAGSILAMSADNAAAFYLPFFRFWQLAAGGFLALTAMPLPRDSRARNIMTLGGIGLIGIALLAIEQRRAYPGWYALLPTLGACLAIAGGSTGFPDRILLSRPIVAIGLISYPLYLWHWPLLTFATILAGPLPSRSLRATLVVASVALAGLTYRYVERPMRASHAVRPIAGILLVALLIAGSAGYWSYSSGGVPSRPAARAAEPFISTIKRSPRQCIDIAAADRDADSFYCHLNESGSPADTIVFGDSHAFSLLPAFEAIANDRRQDILFTSASGCPPLLGITRPGEAPGPSACASFNERVLQLVRDRKLAHVFLVGNWTYYTEGNYRGENLNVIAFGSTPPTQQGSREAFQAGLRQTLSRYAELPVTLHFVGKVPAQPRAAIDLAREVVMRQASPDVTIASVSVTEEQHRRSMTFVDATFAATGVRETLSNRVELIPLEPVYCRSGICPFGTSDASYYFDDSHLSITGALLAVPVLERHFTR